MARDIHDSTLSSINFLDLILWVVPAVWWQRPPSAEPYKTHLQLHQVMDLWFGHSIPVATVVVGVAEAAVALDGVRMYAVDSHMRHLSSLHDGRVSLP